MSTYTLTASRRAAYAALFDFRSQFVKAARQILTAGGIAAVGPGDGIRNLPRHYTSVDFQRGAATGRRTTVPLGDYRHAEYAQYVGILTILNSVPFETEEQSGEAYLTETHLRTLDELVATEYALFMEHLEPFTSDLLPNLDVQELIPVEPDDRPVSEREVNVAFVRFRVRFEIRPSAWPAD